jgi:choline kinase
MDALIKTQHHDYWWENVLYSFTDFKEKNIYTVDVNGLFWSEIDYFDDYERILNYMDQKKGNLNL